MTLENALRLRNGDEVTWNDPDNDLCTVTGVISKVEVSADERVARIFWVDGGFVECYIDELT